MKAYNWLNYAFFTFSKISKPPFFPFFCSADHAINQYGRVFTNGRPLPEELRLSILKMAQANMRPCDISRKLKISHGCISKLLLRHVKLLNVAHIRVAKTSAGALSETRHGWEDQDDVVLCLVAVSVSWVVYRRTGDIRAGAIGGSKPKVSTEFVVLSVRQYKAEHPHMFAWEIRQRLLTDGICSQETLPSISSVNRILRTNLPSAGASLPPSVDSRPDDVSGINQVCSKILSAKKKCDLHLVGFCAGCYRSPRLSCFFFVVLASVICVPFMVRIWLHVEGELVWQP
ncbi:unnamed protein product [Protopolystoma xenopodis]|uniref:Paired domain-containing protein n=1 Tax=Protopolystoma xenopodis TaxID=117903 RepID=A0A3S5ABZ1_9PLAT|nr:unnamed protein product [Protopolystoma xenopodis]